MAQDTKKKTKATAAPPLPPPRPVELTLPVRLTSVRRALLGAELADMNKALRQLEADKKAASKKFGAQIAALNVRSVPVEEALQTKGEQVVPLLVQCEARPVAGNPSALDVFRMDTDPPTFVKRITAPSAEEQTTIPGVETPEGPTQEERDRIFGEEVAKALGDVPYPDDDEEQNPGEVLPGDAEAEPSAPFADDPAGGPASDPFT